MGAVSGGSPGGAQPRCPGSQDGRRGRGWRCGVGCPQCPCVGQDGWQQSRSPRRWQELGGCPGAVGGDAGSIGAGTGTRRGVWHGGTSPSRQQVLRAAILLLLLLLTSGQPWVRAAGAGRGLLPADASGLSWELGPSLRTLGSRGEPRAAPPSNNAALGRWVQGAIRGWGRGRRLFSWSCIKTGGKISRAEGDSRPGHVLGAGEAPRGALTNRDPAGVRGRFRCDEGRSRHPPHPPSRSSPVTRPASPCRDGAELGVMPELRQLGCGSRGVPGAVGQWLWSRGMLRSGKQQQCWQGGLRQHPPTPGEGRGVRLAPSPHYFLSGREQEEQKGDQKPPAASAGCAGSAGRSQRARHVSHQFLR